jgi:hypothetical protein
MAFTTNALSLMNQPLTGGPRIWAYSSTEAGTAVDADEYFAEGYARGMRANDIVIVTNTATGTITSHVILTAQSTSIDLGDGTTIGSTANAD